MWLNWELANKYFSKRFPSTGGKNEEIIIVVFPQFFQRDLTEKIIKKLNTASQTVQIIF